MFPQSFPRCKVEGTCKPDSVPPVLPGGGGHSSGTAVAGGLKQPTRRLRQGGLQRLPIWSCSARGLPCHLRYRRMRWALTSPFHPCHLPEGRFGGLFSVALSV